MHKCVHIFICAYMCACIYTRIYACIYANTNIFASGSGPAPLPHGMRLGKEPLSDGSGPHRQWPNLFLYIKNPDLCGTAAGSESPSPCDDRLMLRLKAGRIFFLLAIPN